MLQRLRKKIADLRREPEEVRFQAAIRYTVIGGIILLLFWLGVLLPLQLHKVL